MKSGFTLIELSIVLVIIGLIVGGVLVGRDLIKAAENRSQISQIEKYRTAVFAFRNKYSCMPGDCSSYAQFGFVTRRDHPEMLSDPPQTISNDIVENCNADTTFIHNCEAALFWRDLSQSELITESFVTAVDGGGVFASTPDDIALHIPRAKLGGSKYVGINGTNNYNAGRNAGINLFYLFGFTEFQDNEVNQTVISSATATGLTSAQAFAFDSKVDDGLPGTGTVQSGLASLGVVAVDLDGRMCDLQNAGTINAYSLTPSFENTPGCWIRIRM